MKNLLLILILFTPLMTHALDCTTTSDAQVIQESNEIKTDVPKFLQGATITVRTADGKESVVSADKFKVVPRVQQFIITRTKQLDKTICTPEKNRVSILAGNGTKEGLDRSRTSNTVTVESKTGAIGGIQYQRLLPLLDDRLSVGAQAQTNDSLLLNIGLDF